MKHLHFQEPVKVISFDLGEIREAKVLIGSDTWECIIDDESERDLPGELKI